MATLSILDALKAMMISTNVRELLAENNAVWVGFGKKNSHILRTMLFKLFASSKLSKEAIIWIYFFHALIKDKDRIIMAYNTLPENLQNNEDIKEAIKFMRTKMVKYTKDETASKFASVHLPNTNPGMDIVLYILSLGNHTIEEAQNKLDEVFKEVMARTTMTQIRLDSEMMSKNEEYVKDYWEKTVVYKNREERIKNKQAVGFVKEYYDTAAGDMYDLIDENFKIVKTKNSFYSEQDIVDYIFGVLTWKYREENQDDEGDDDDSGNDNKKNKGKEPEKQASKEKMKEFGPLLKKPTSPKTPRTIKPSTRK